MKFRQLWKLLLIPSCLAMSCASPSSVDDGNGKLEIHGQDDRLDLYQLPENSEIIEWARSTAFLVPRSTLEPDGPEYHALATYKLKSAQNTCNDVAYADQPMAEGASAFLIGPNLVASAGHFTKTFGYTCNDIAFIFDFAIFDPDATNKELSRIPNRNIYFCSELVVERYEGSNETNLVDYAIFRLTERIDDRPYRDLNLQMPAINTEVIAIGNGLGLPTKVAKGVVTRKTSNFFFTNLDLFLGNSGSLVLDAAEGHILGIAVGAPNAPFQLRKNADGTTCNELVPCPEQVDFSKDTCWGNIITPSATFADFVTQ